jgi:hypothetical protein
MKVQKKLAFRGFSSVQAMIFVVLFSVLAISFTAMSNINVQMSRNHRDLSAAQAAAESGLEYAGFLTSGYVPPDVAYSPQNTVSESEARDTFTYFAAYVETILGSSNVSWDSSNLELRVPANGGISLSTGTSATFSLLFEFLPGDTNNPHRMTVTSTGGAFGISRAVLLAFPIRKDNRVLQYAIASRGRIWLTGDSTIEGDIFSDWDNVAQSPFNITSDSKVNGTINTVLTKQQCIDAGWQMETLDEDGNPMFAENGDRIYSSWDEVQGEHEGINYDQFSDVPGMSIDDYDTDGYNDGLAEIPLCPSGDRETEYFPHVAGDYGQPSKYWSRQLDRHVYESQTFTDSYLPDNRNALFRNCTFEGILYVDCNKSGSINYNNVRFEDCTFNGAVITDVPEVLKWQHNCLYYTGSATFQNEAMAEATILAPHFNVNLGNTDPTAGDTNELTGAIVGGIVDIRGNAQVYGTIISMCDTTQWTSGYVTNIGATLEDGGNETTEPGDVGVISITPDEDQMLPSGITTPIVIGDADGDTYVEL